MTIFLSSVYAYPNGAGGCAGGKAAAEGYHLATVAGKKVFPKTLGAKGVKFTIGNVTIAAGSSGVASYGKIVSINITGSNMKGILIRVQAPNGVSSSNALVPGPGLQKCQYCTAGIGSATHKVAKLNNWFGSTIKFINATKPVIFDITVVFSNNATISEFAYGRVLVNFTKK
jgi:hypothetical protein